MPALRNRKPSNRLTAVAHRTWSGSAWTDPARYNESGIGYDLNGNIKSYIRQGLGSGTSTFGTIDNLVYTYGDVARPDHLTQLADAGNNDGVTATLNLDGTPRIQGLRVDMRAYESPFTSSAKEMLAG